MPALSASAFDRARTSLAEFWRWWIGELGQMVPRLGIAIPGSAAATAEIRPYRDRIEIIRWVNGAGERLVERTPLDELGDESWAEMAELTSGCNARIILAAPLIHVLRLKFPKAARARLRSAIPLKLRDASPIDPTSVTWRVVNIIPQEEQIEVSIAIVRTHLIERFVAGLSVHLARVPPIYAEADGRQIFLRGRGGRFSISAPWLVAVGLLLSTPFCILLALFVLVAVKRSDVAQLEQNVGPKLAIERTIRDRYDAARALDGIVRLPMISAIIDDLAQHLPDDVTVHDLTSSADNMLSIAVETSNADALRAALAADPHMSGLREMDQSTTSQGTFLIRYQGKPR